MEFRGGTVVIVNGRVVRTVDKGELRRVLEQAREARRREVSATTVTLTMEADSTDASAVLRLYAAASSATFDDRFIERVPVVRPAAPIPRRRVARPPRPRRPTAPRLVSWLVEGRGR